MPYAQCGDNRLGDARCAEQVTCRALGGTARSVATEHIKDRLVFSGVVRSRSGAVQVDIVNVTGLQSRGAQCTYPEDDLRSFWGADAKRFRSAGNLLAERT